MVSDNPLDDLDAIIAAHDPAQPTPDEERAQHSIEDQADWLAGQLAGKRPAEVQQMVLNRLQDASTVAQMKQVLIELLPTIAAGVVALAYQAQEE